MLRYNQERMTQLISQLRTALDRLRSLQSLSKEAFLQDPHKVGSAKYHFIVAIEAAIDLGNHLIAQNGYRAPNDYADTFQVLGEAGIISGDFVPILKQMARFRNRLVHLYWEVDDGTVYEILQTHLPDFKKYLDQITQSLERW